MFLFCSTSDDSYWASPSGRMVLLLFFIQAGLGQVRGRPGGRSNGRSNARSNTDQAPSHTRAKHAQLATFRAAAPGSALSQAQFLRAHPPHHTPSASEPPPPPPKK
jgi:hypothetical protein